MDTVKRGRTKVERGDCVSVPNNYFGDDFKARMEAAGVRDERIYGRVEDVVDGNRNFVVRWDIDQQATSTSLDKVRYEPVDTPFQEARSSSIITEADLENLAGPLEQGSVEPHDQIYVLSTGKGNTRTDCLLGRLIPCKPGTIVHHHEMGDNEQKFVIDQVLNMWTDFNADIHSPGSFVVWNKDYATLQGEKEGDEMKEKESEKIKKKADKKKDNKSNTKAKKSVKSKDGGKSVRSKDAGTKFRQSLKEIESDKDSDSDQEKELEEKRKSRKRKNNSNVEKKVESEEDSDDSDKENNEDGEVKQQQKKKLPRRAATKSKNNNISTKKMTVVLGAAACKLLKSNKRLRSIKNKTGKKQKKEVESSQQQVTDEESEASSSSSDEEIDPKTQAIIEEQKNTWKEGGWNIDPKSSGNRRSELNMVDVNVQNELSFFLHFLPTNYIKDVVLPATNDYARSVVPNFKEITFQELMVCLGLIYTMEIYKLPERRMYWMDLECPFLLPNMNFGKHMSRNRFDDILSYLQLSRDDDKDRQITDFLDAVNEQLAAAVNPGNVLVLDESMIKAFHCHLKGKIKIKRKPRPIGNEIKDLSDGNTNIVLRLELYEGKEDMAEKEHVQEFGATCATSLRLTQKYHGSGRIVIADAWFGSVKTAVQLRKKGLFSIMIVKTAHARFPRALLDSHNLQRGQWTAYTASIDGEDVQAISFIDLKKKQFVSTCSTILPGNPRKTKHHGDVPRPVVAETYLHYADSIDVHNHVRTGSLGLEDVLLTTSPHLRQFTGIVGFIFTNAYLAMKYFKLNQSGLKHVDFKIALATQLVKYDSGRTRRSVSAAPAPPTTTTSSDIHQTSKLAYSKPCYVCQHGGKDGIRRCTTFECSFCKVPIHKPSFRDQKTGQMFHCWDMHLERQPLEEKMPKLRRGDKE